MRTTKSNTVTQKQECKSQSQEGEVASGSRHLRFSTCAKEVDQAIPYVSAGTVKFRTETD